DVEDAAGGEDGVALISSVEAGLGEGADQQPQVAVGGHDDLAARVGVVIGVQQHRGDLVALQGAVGGAHACLVDPDEQLLAVVQAGQGLALARKSLAGASGLLVALGSVAGGLHRPGGVHASSSSSSAMSPPSGVATTAVKARTAPMVASRNEGRPLSQSTQ